jgi:hypothetical protein
LYITLSASNWFDIAFVCVVIKVLICHPQEQLERLFSRIVQRKQWSILRLILTSSGCQSSNVVEALNVRVESEDLGSRWGNVPLVLVVAMSKEEELCTLMMQKGVDMNATSTVRVLAVHLTVSYNGIITSPTNPTPSTLSKLEGPLVLISK